MTGAQKLDHTLVVKTHHHLGRTEIVLHILTLIVWTHPQLGIARPTLLIQYEWNDFPKETGVPIMAT